jgi:hypothetical protein
MGGSIFHIPLTFAEVKIPVIVVFTKFDLLIVEHFRSCNHMLSLADRKAEAMDRAKRAFNLFTKGLKVPFAPVSTLKEAQKDYGGLLIRSLTCLFPLKLLLYCRSDAR